VNNALDPIVTGGASDSPPQTKAVEKGAGRSMASRNGAAKEKPLLKKEVQKEERKKRSLGKPKTGGNEVTGSARKSKEVKMETKDGWKKKMKKHLPRQDSLLKSAGPGTNKYKETSSRNFKVRDRIKYNRGEKKTGRKRLECQHNQREIRRATGWDLIN